MPHDTAHSAIHHTTTYLCFCKSEALGELQTFGDWQILVFFKLCLQRLDLRWCEGRAWPFLALIRYRVQWERSGVAATARVRAAGCPARSARGPRTLCNTVHKIAVACLPCYLKRRNVSSCNPRSGGGGLSKFQKNTYFVRHDNTNVLHALTLQSKSATAIGWWPAHWNSAKICRFFFSFSVSFSFPFNRTVHQLGDFDTIFITDFKT